MKTKFLILGAGIGGLATGARLKECGEEDFLIVDKSQSIPLNLNNGVHYLHSDDFGTPFPFELKKITATEEIWNPRTDTFKKVSNIPEMIDYSLKVFDLRHPSSIMDPGNRNWNTYVPISNNMNDLIQAYYNYIGKEHFIWNKTIEKLNKNSQYIISTIPLPKMYEMIDEKSHYEFKNNPIYITNYKTKNIVGNWLISIYISDSKFPPHRITILNNIISMESLAPLTISEEHIVKYHLERYFDYDLETKESSVWPTGRIWGLTKSEREEIVALFASKNIFLLGRYGLWNGKLLMDSTIIQAKKIVDYILNPKDELKFIKEISL